MTIPFDGLTKNCGNKECGQVNPQTVEACVMATDKPNHSRTGCEAEGDVFERDRKSSVVGRDMGLRVLVVCEFSGIVRDAFRARGVDAWSCDLLASE
jgi:hypothetical protein